MCRDNPDFEQCCPDCGAPGEVNGHYGCPDPNGEEREELFLKLEREEWEEKHGQSYADYMDSPSLEDHEAYPHMENGYSEGE